MDRDFILKQKVRLGEPNRATHACFCPRDFDSNLISHVNLTGKQVSISIEAQYAVLVELPTKVRVFSKFDRYNEYSSHALHRVNKCIISAHYASKKNHWRYSRHRGYIHTSLLYIRWALFRGRKNQLAHAWQAQ